MILLFDIGASKTRVAVTTDGQGFGEPKIVPTPAEPIAAAAALAAAPAPKSTRRPPAAALSPATRLLITENRSNRLRIMFPARRWRRRPAGRRARRPTRLFGRL